jgi:hypothetical protein
MRWSLATLLATRVVALLAIGMLASFGASPAAAENPAGDGAFCIRGFTYGGAGGLGDCSFSSYAQCRATASGQEAWCLANPYYNGNVETQPGRGRISRRRS